jgi:uncharacterized protein YkwD
MPDLKTKRAAPYMQRSSSAHVPPLADARSGGKLSAMRRFIVILVIIAGILPFPQPSQAQGDVVSTLLSRLNQLRVSHGLNPLALNAQLTAAAQSHSNYLASTVYIHPHRERDGSLPQDRAARAGYMGRVSENVVGGTGATLDWAWNWWLASPIHYQNMLGDWSEVGIGYADGGEYGRWYTTDFGNAGRPTLPSEGYTGLNPAATPNSLGSGSGGGAAAVAVAPTRRPRPTSTPTVTLTPSITYTPLPTLTPTVTLTPAPPTATAIVIQVSPQPTTPPAITETSTSSAVAVALAPSAAPTLELPPPADLPPQPGSSIRNLIPWAIGLQVLVVGGLAIGAITRRRRA